MTSNSTVKSILRKVFKRIGHGTRDQFRRMFISRRKEQSTVSSMAGETITTPRIKTSKMNKMSLLKGSLGQ